MPISSTFPSNMLTHCFVLPTRQAPRCRYTWPRGLSHTPAPSQLPLSRQSSAYVVLSQESLGNRTFCSLPLLAHSCMVPTTVFQSSLRDAIIHICLHKQVISQNHTVLCTLVSSRVPAASSSNILLERKP